MLDVKGIRRCDAEAGTYGRWHTCMKRAKFTAVPGEYTDPAYGSLDYCARHANHCNNPKYSTIKRVLQPLS